MVSVRISTCLGVGQAQAGDAVMVLIRRFYWSRTDLAKTVAIMNSTGGVEYSDVIVVGIAFILPLELIIICMLCDN